VAYKVDRLNQVKHPAAITEQVVEVVEPAEAHELFCRLKISFVIAVPFFVRGSLLGTLSLMWTKPDHHSIADDLALTEELAARVAVALDNARLFSEAQLLNAELDNRVLKRTRQLQKTKLRLSKEVEDRKRAEEKYRQLNIELEERIIERTHQLENANRKLRHEIFDRERAENALRSSLEKTRELYQISQSLGLANTPNELLTILLSSTLLGSVVRASVAIFDQVWRKDGPVPAFCTILTAWNKQPQSLLYTGQKMTLAEYGLVKPYSRSQPLIIPEIKSDSRISETMRRRLMSTGAVGSIIFPLIAGGEWYGLMSLHFDQIIKIKAGDIRHLRGMVDEMAVGIHNFILLRTEAQARQEAEEANNLKLKFLAMVSHELRTPLTSIKGFSATLLADDVEWTAENQRDFIETISVEADKLSELIEQLLDLSRLEAGAIRINPKRVAWNQVISTSMSQLNALTSNHQLVIDEIPSDLPALIVDVARVSQVITNLVDNSVKYSPQNTTIVLTTEKLSDQFIKVSVIDEGIGIPLEARGRIFEAFQQLEFKKSKTYGAGLGLAICRGLIEAHGGRIWVDEHRGNGATLSFTLPIAGE
jgi:signal transduction histidine kinase